MSNSKIYLGSTNLGTGKIKLGANDVSAIYLGSSLLYPPSSPADVNYVTITNTSQNSGTFSVYSSDSNFPNYTNLEYSLDGGTTWTTLNTVYDTVTVPSGDSILLRGTGNGEDFDNEEFTKLNFSESHTVSGNLANLVDYTAEPQIVPNYAFYKLFNNDTTLTQANLFDTDFDNGGIDAFDSIFYGCSSLNSVSVTTNNWNSSKHDNWLNGAAATGTIYVNGDATNLPLNNTSGVPVGWTVQNTIDYLCFTVETAPFTFNLGGKGNAVVYYSTDKTNWNLLSNYSDVTLQNVGDKVYFYGNNPNGFSYSQSNFDKFHTSAGSYSVSGNIMSLIDISCPSTIPNSYCFATLFSGTSIVSAEHLLLPAQTLTDHCYFDMFARSTLSTPPELPATTLAASCYAFMFDDTDITESPILAVGILPQSCYYRMFRNCSNLNTVTCLATDITAQYCTQNWLENAPATGTFTKNPQMSSWTTGSDGIPTGWTVEDYYDCSDCNNWEECGYSSYEDCDCAENGNCGGDEPDYCQECIDACEGDPDCEASCYECDQPCGEPCVVDCSDWENMGYESYEDCDCQENGNCPEEEEPEE